MPRCLTRIWKEQPLLQLMFPDETLKVFLVELFFFPLVTSAMAEREVGGRGENSISRWLWRKGSTCRTLDDPKYQTGEKPRDHGSGLRKEGHVTIHDLSPRAVPGSRMAFQAQHWETADAGISGHCPALCLWLSVGFTVFTNGNRSMAGSVL